MSQTTRARPPSRRSLTEAFTLLENGDHLDQKTFHARYQQTSEEFRAELIGGVVYVSSPMKKRHGRMHSCVMRWLLHYEEATPGTEVLDNTTDILAEDSEPQPDACLLLLPEKGGQTRETADGYLEGPADFIAEVSSSTEAIDLHAKKTDYERAGVKEYLVVALKQMRVFWFVSRRGKFRDLAPSADGILRSKAFPGLWLDPAALLRRDRRRLLQVLRQGLNSPEHAAWVAKLERM